MHIRTCLAAADSLLAVTADLLGPAASASAATGGPNSAGSLVVGYTVSTTTPSASTSSLGGWNWCVTRTTRSAAT